MIENLSIGQGIFYAAAIVALFSTGLAITRKNAVHALLYLIVSLLAVAFIFYLLGAPFAAALEVIIYAGAVMVLYIFVFMMLNLGHQTVEQESQWLIPGTWWGPSLLAAILLMELVAVLFTGGTLTIDSRPVDTKEVAIALFGPYVLGVELAAMLLLAGMVSAFHIARKSSPNAMKKLRLENKSLDNKNLPNKRQHSGRFS